MGNTMVGITGGTMENIMGSIMGIMGRSNLYFRFLQ